MVKLARIKSDKFLAAAKANANKQWGACLRGGVTPPSVHKDRATKRAFAFVRGPAGWAHSPIGTQAEEDSIPFESDQTEDDASGGGACECPAIWTGKGTDRPLSEQAAVELEANSWASLWNEGRPGCRGEPIVDPTIPDALRVHEFRKAALTFPTHTGRGADNIAPRAIARLSDALLSCLCWILHLVEVQGTWPEVVKLVLIVLLPKRDGGRRPIGLLPTIVRIWMRARACIARRWEAQCSMPAFYGGTGMGAQRAAWQIAFRAEAAAADKTV